MRLLTFASFLLLVGVLGGCATIDPNMSQVWVVLGNSTHAAAMGSRATVVIDDNRMMELPNEDTGVYLAVKLAPGKHDIRVLSSPGEYESLSFEAVAGARHYFIVEWGRSNGRLMSPSKAGITPVDQNTGRATLEREVSLYKMAKSFLAK